MARRESVPLNRAEATSGGIAVAGNDNVLVFHASADVVREDRTGRQQVADLYRQGPLLDRASDLQDLTDFLTDKGGGWWGWRGVPWTGKTRLMAEVACAPPTGWRAVSFFIRRGRGTNTEEAFLRGVIPQLAAIVGMPRVELGDVPAQVALLHELLEKAAAACDAAGERLLVVIDGLDEDAVFTGEQSRSVLDVMPFIADRFAIVVASRPIPDLRLPSHHPLQQEAAWRHLRRVPSAKVAERDAREDMTALLRDQLGRDVAALLELTGHPLTARHLASITGAPIGEVDEIFRSGSGRCFSALDVEDGRGPGYVLGHLTLQQMLIEHLDPDAPDPNSADDHERAAWAAARAEALSPWKARVSEWGASWASQGWPRWTPDYLLEENYLDLLEGNDLVIVLTDPKRHACIAARYGSLGPALAQLRVHAARFLPDWRPDQEPAPRVHLEYVGQLMFALDDLTRSGARVPATMPSILARAGQHRRAEQLVDATDDVLGALSALAVAYHDTAESERFLAAASRFLEQLSSVTGMSPTTAQQCADMASLCARAGHVKPARQVAMAIPVSDGQHQNTLAAAVLALAVAGEAERAFGAAAMLPESDRFVALRDSAYLTHRWGDHVAALSCAQAAAALVEDIDSDWLGHLLALARLYVELGEMHEARSIARKLSSRDRVDVLVDLVEWHRSRQEYEAASRAADEAGCEVADLVPANPLDARSVVRLAASLIGLGRAEVAGSVVEPCAAHIDHRSHARLAAAYFAAGNAEEAQPHLAAALADNPHNHGWSSVLEFEETLAELLPAAPHVELDAMIARFAAEVASAGDDPFVRAAAIRTATRLAHAGRKADALRLVEVLPTPHPSFSNEAYLRLAHGLAGGPEWRDTLAILDLASPEPQDIVDVADMLMRSGHPDLALQAANQAVRVVPLPGPDHSQLHEIAYVLSEGGHWDVAMRVSAATSKHLRYHAYFWTADAAARRDPSSAADLAQPELYRPSVEIPLLTGLANGALALNRKEPARPLLARAADLLRSSFDDPAPEAIRNVVRLMAYLGECSAAMDLIAEVAPSEDQCDLLASVAGVCAGVGCLQNSYTAVDRALTQALGISNSHERVHACVALTRCLAQYPSLVDTARAAADEAHRAFTNLSAPERLAKEHVIDLYSQLASAAAEGLALTERTELATELCAHLRSQGGKPDTFRLAPALAAGGDLTGALHLIDEETSRIHPPPLERVIAVIRTADALDAVSHHLARTSDAKAAGLNQLAIAYADIDRPKLARQVARQALEAAAASDGYDRGEQMLKAAWTLRRLEHIEEARSAALSAAAELCARRAGVSSQSFVECAELLKRLGDEEASRRLLVEAWRVEGHPLVGWLLLASLDREAAVALALKRWPPSSDAAATAARR